MICKECGAKLSVRDTTCPRCGAAVPASEGGVGFWDMLDGPVNAVKLVNPSQPVSRPDRLDGQNADTAGEESEMKVTNEKTSLPIVVCCALSTVCLLGTLVSGFLAMSSANATRADLQKEVSALKGEVNKLKGVVADVRGTQSSMQLGIEKTPKDTRKPDGLEDESVLFELAVSGKVKSFTWQKKQNDSDDWTELYFDEEGINVEYGLKLEEDLEAGTTSLLAVGLTADSSGTYRCVVRGVYGDEQAPSATLTVLPESDALLDETEEGYGDETSTEEGAEDGGTEATGTDETETGAADTVAPGTPVQLDEYGDPYIESDVSEE